MITAKFGSKQFEVSAKTILTPNGLNYSEAIEIEEVERSGKKPALNLKGEKLMSLGFKLQLDARFVDIVTEIKWWKSTLNAKKSYDLTLGKYKIGKFLVASYSVSDITENKDGTWTKAVLDLSFTEDSGARSSGSSSSGASTSGSANNSVEAVKESAGNVNTGITYAVGDSVKPYSNTRMYDSATNAYNMSGSSSAAIVTPTYTVTRAGLADFPGIIYIKGTYGKTYAGWMRAEDVYAVTKSTFTGAKSGSTTQTTQKEESTDSQMPKYLPGTNVPVSEEMKYLLGFK